jgi:hypothetical protein
MSNDITPHIRSIEAQVEAAGMSMTVFLAQAGVARTTWWRWRVGRGLPNMRSWNRVRRVASRLPWGNGDQHKHLGATL